MDFFKSFTIKDWATIALLCISLFGSYYDLKNQISLVANNQNKLYEDVKSWQAAQSKRDDAQDVNTARMALDLKDILRDNKNDIKDELRYLREDINNRARSTLPNGPNK